MLRRWERVHCSWRGLLLLLLLPAVLGLLLLPLLLLHLVLVVLPHGHIGLGLLVHQ